MDAVNDGALILTAPALHLKKTNLIINSSAILSFLTCVGACYASSTLIGNADPDQAKLGLIGASLFAYCALGDCLNSIYSEGIIRYLVPLITFGYFNPSDTTPLEIFEHLRGKLTCPILLHFHKKDGVLKEPDLDTAKLYDVLAGEKTHFVRTDDGAHNRRSRFFADIVKNFKEKYVYGIKPIPTQTMYLYEHPDIENTQPKKEWLPRLFVPRGIMASISSKKYALISCLLAIIWCRFYR